VVRCAAANEVKGDTMILLEKLLDGLDVEVQPFTVCELRPAGIIDLGSHRQAVLHLMLDGGGRLRLNGRGSFDLPRNAMMIVPPRLRQRLLAIGETAPRASNGSAGAPVACRLVCGHLTATYHDTQGLFDYLDDPIIEQLADGDPLRQAVVRLLAEQSLSQPGSQAMCRALLKQCLVLLLRRHCDSGECQVPWLTALEDERLGRVLQVMLDRPETPHSLHSLAIVAGMSRSSFAAHFAQAFERPPMEFLKVIRLRRAAKLLAVEGLPVKTLAARVGYDSRSHFSRAFKDFYGVSPSEFRDRAEAGPASVSRLSET
jgi:AraC-like DNA-binding protein